MCRTRRCWTSLMKLMRRTPIHRSPNWRGSGGGSSFIGRECSGEQRRGHFGVAEHGRPFAEGEVRGDDDAGPLIKLADEVEQQLPPRAGERQITELVEHDQVEPRQLRRQGPAFADPGLLFEACHQLEGSQDFERLDLVDGSVPDGRCKLVEKIVGLDDRALGAAILDHHLFNILTCDCLERLRRKKLLADLLLPLLKGWVAPRSNSLARLVGRVPRLLEADLGITPDCELLLDLADPVPETPQLAASRRDLDIEAALVSDLVRLVFRLEGAKPSLGQRHVRAFSQCGFRKGPQKARKNVWNPREQTGRSGTIQGPNP